MTIQEMSATPVAKKLKLTSFLSKEEVLSSLYEHAHTVGSDWFVIEDKQLQHVGFTYPNAFDIFADEYATYGRIVEAICK